jgi:hypothetical protein
MVYVCNGVQISTCDLIHSQDPETNEPLTKAEIETEAFAFLYADSLAAECYPCLCFLQSCGDSHDEYHVDLFFWSLLHDSQAVKSLLMELDSRLSLKLDPSAVEPYDVTSQVREIQLLLDTEKTHAVSTHQLMNLDVCIKENRRLNAVFNMPLPRRVPEEGLTIAEHFTLGGVCDILRLDLM